MPSSTSSSRSLGLILGVALFLGAEQAIWSSTDIARFLLRHQPLAASGDTIGVSARIRLIETGGPPLLILLGSSQVREGVDCEILLASSGEGTCLNLGIGGGSPLDMLHVSRELKGLPRTVVISIFPGVLQKAPKSGFIDGQTIRTIVQSGVISNLTPHDLRLLALGLLQSFSPTLRHREALREAFREWRQPHQRAQDPSSRLRRTTDEDRKPPRYFENRVGRIDIDHALSTFAPAQALALDHLINRERERGHRVVLVDFPTRPGFETTLATDVRAHYAGLLARLRSRPDILFLDAAELGPLAEAQFLDFTHLDSNGRRLVSERLGRALAH